VEEDGHACCSWGNDDEYSAEMFLFGIRSSRPDQEDDDGHSCCDRDSHGARTEPLPPDRSDRPDVGNHDERRACCHDEEPLRGSRLAVVCDGSRACCWKRDVDGVLRREKFPRGRAGSKLAVPCDGRARWWQRDVDGVLCREKVPSGCGGRWLPENVVVDEDGRAWWWGSCCSRVCIRVWEEEVLAARVRLAAASASRWARYSTLVRRIEHSSSYRSSKACPDLARWRTLPRPTAGEGNRGRKRDDDSPEPAKEERRLLGGSGGWREERRCDWDKIDPLGKPRQDEGLAAAAVEEVEEGVCRGGGGARSMEEGGD
jgi:hypothetical protein